MSAKKSQSDKFQEAARELGADGDEETLDRALRKMKERPAKDKKPEDD